MLLQRHLVTHVRNTPGSSPAMPEGSHCLPCLWCLCGGSKAHKEAALVLSLQAKPAALEMHLTTGRQALQRKESACSIAQDKHGLLFKRHFSVSPRPAIAAL